MLHFNGLVISTFICVIMPFSTSHENGLLHWLSLALTYLFNYVIFNCEHS